MVREAAERNGKKLADGWKLEPVNKEGDDGDSKGNILDLFKSKHMVSLLSI